MTSRDEKKLKKYFEKKIKQGNILKSKQLRKYANNRKLKVSSKFKSCYYGTAEIGFNPIPRGL